MRICLILALMGVTAPAWAEPKKLDEQTAEIGEYRLYLSRFENDELDEAYWYFSTLEVYRGHQTEKYDVYPKLFDSTGFNVFGTEENPVIYISKIGGSGNGGGVYRYQPALKKLDFFQGGEGNNFAGFAEIYKYEDVDGDGMPELFATSRHYDDNGFRHYWTVYKWPLEASQPHIGKGEPFEKYLKQMP